MTTPPGSGPGARAWESVHAFFAGGFAAGALFQMAITIIGVSTKYDLILLRTEYALIMMGGVALGAYVWRKSRPPMDKNTA